MFSGSINKITTIQTTVPAYEKLMEALRTLTAEESGQAQMTPIQFEKEIEFRNVCFTYQGSGEAVLHHVNFTLKKGSITALMGRSGAGKTTIADLLMGFLEPTSGEILIDGIRLSAGNLSGWRHDLGYIPQEPLILNATVRENLQRFHPTATQAKMEKALKKPAIWADKLLELIEKNERRENSALIRENGYDISRSYSWMQQFYLEKMKQIQKTAA